MAAVRGRDTQPELVVRKALHRMGFRYVLHDRRLPGRPDLVFPRRKKAIFVHGCFWHRHEACSLARLPKSRTDFWLAKLTKNALRDERQIAVLKALGWSVHVVWECELAKPESAIARARKFLEGTDASC